MAPRVTAAKTKAKPKPKTKSKSKAKSAHKAPSYTSKWRYIRDNIALSRLARVKHKLRKREITRWDTKTRLILFIHILFVKRPHISEMEWCRIAKMWKGSWNGLRIEYRQTMLALFPDDWTYRGSEAKKLAASSETAEPKKRERVGDDPEANAKLERRIARVRRALNRRRWFGYKAGTNWSIPPCVWARRHYGSLVKRTPN